MAFLTAVGGAEGVSRVVAWLVCSVVMRFPGFVVLWFCCFAFLLFPRIALIEEKKRAHRKVPKRRNPVRPVLSVVAFGALSPIMSWPRWLAIAHPNRYVIARWVERLVLGNLEISARLR